MSGYNAPSIRKLKQEVLFKPCAQRLSGITLIRVDDSREWMHLLQSCQMGKEISRCATFDQCCHLACHQIAEAVNANASRPDTRQWKLEFRRPSRNLKAQDGRAAC